MISSKQGVLIAFAASMSILPIFGQDNPPASSFDVTPSLDACNVTWNTPGPSSQQSMPIGNGDIGLNVWVESSGDLAFTSARPIRGAYKTTC